MAGPLHVGAVPSKSRQGSQWRDVAESRRSAFAQGRNAFRDIRRGEIDKFKSEGRVENRPCKAKPVVESVFGEADRVLRSGGESGCDIDRFVIDVIILVAERHKPDSLGLLPGEIIVEQ